MAIGLVFFFLSFFLSVCLSPPSLSLSLSPPSPGHLFGALLAGVFESFYFGDEFFLVDEESVDFVRQSLPVHARPIQRRFQPVRVLIHAQIPRRQPAKTTDVADYLLNFVALINARPRILALYCPSLCPCVSPKVTHSPCYHYFHSISKHLLCS